MKVPNKSEQELMFLFEIPNNFFPFFVSISVLWPTSSYVFSLIVFLTWFNNSLKYFLDLSIIFPASKHYRNDRNPEIVVMQLYLKNISKHNSNSYVNRFDSYKKVTRMAKITKENWSYCLANIIPNNFQDLTSKNIL